MARMAKYILGVCVVVAVVTIGILVAAPIFLNSEDGERLQESMYVTPYDWSLLQAEGSQLRYVENGEVKSRIGIDVSENQHWIDWESVAKDGIEFAMIRLGYRGATEGDMYVDEYFEANMAGAEAVGIDRGIYFFSQAKTPDEAIEEADFVLEHLGDRQLQYPIAYDSEERIIGVSESRTTGLEKAEMTAIADAFYQRIADAGYEVLIYGNAHDMSRYRRSSLDNKEVWWAEYGVAAPTNKLDIVLWQYTNVGHVAGIEGDVDMNLDLRAVFN